MALENGLVDLELILFEEPRTNLYAKPNISFARLHIKLQGKIVVNCIRISERYIVYFQVLGLVSCIFPGTGLYNIVYFQVLGIVYCIFPGLGCILYISRSWV